MKHFPRGSKERQVACLLHILRKELAWRQSLEWKASHPAEVKLLEVISLFWAEWFIIPLVKLSLQDLVRQERV